MAQLIDGKKLAEDVVSTVKRETEKLVSATGVVPGIAVVIVGEDRQARSMLPRRAKRPRNAVCIRSA
jgi:methylenetetrahydrofolate dehydrogenase (NADP+)/methenyltetrahydrofolate cyclohydrolase